jgi:hypothetical protein
MNEDHEFHDRVRPMCLFFYFFLFCFAPLGVVAAVLADVRRSESLSIYFCPWALNYISIDYMV